MDTLTISRKPLPTTAALRSWQAVTVRALTRQEREWLEAVPADPVIEFAGRTARWPRPFFCAWVRHGLERGIATVSLDGATLVATMPAGEHRICTQPVGWRPWIEHTLPEEARA